MFLRMLQDAGPTIRYSNIPAGKPYIYLNQRTRVYQVLFQKGGDIAMIHAAQRFVNKLNKQRK